MEEAQHPDLPLVDPENGYFSMFNESDDLSGNSLEMDFQQIQVQPLPEGESSLSELQLQLPVKKKTCSYSDRKR